MEVRQASFSPVAAAALSTTAATSTVCVGGALVELQLVFLMALLAPTLVTYPPPVRSRGQKLRS